MRNLLKITAILLAFSMLLTTGCLNKPQTEDLPEEWSEEENSVEQQNMLLPDPTAENEEPTPDETGTEARICFSGIGAVYKYAARGEQLQITGLEDGFFTAEVDGIPVLADSRLVRLSSEPAWQEKVLFAQHSAAVSSGPYVYSEKLYNISVNQRVNVLDSLGELALIEKDGRSGYLFMKDIGPAISGGGAAPAKDGGEISLSHAAMHYGFLPLRTQERELNVPGIGTVFADGTELYLRFFQKGDTVRVIDQQGDAYVILVDGVRAMVPCFAVEMPGDDVWEPAIRYTVKDAPVYAPYAGLTPSYTLALNTEVQVIAQTDTIAVIQQDGEISYLPAAAVVPEKQEVSAGNSYAPARADTWTPPAL